MVRPAWLALPRAWMVCLLCLAGYVAAPWAALKLVLAAAALASAFAAPGPQLGPSRGPLLRFALGLCFALSLLVPPYWLTFGGEEQGPPWPFLWFAAMLAAGWAWVAAADSLTGDSEASPPIPVWKAAVIAAGLLAIDWAAFFQVVPSRGDESQHIMRLWAGLVYAKVLLQSWPAVLAIALALLAAWLWRRSPRFAAALGGGCGLWIYAAIEASEHADITWLPRYPGFQMWWQATALLWAPVKSWVAQEALYRIVPFAAVLALALYIVRVPLAGSPAPTQLGAAFVVATVPTVRYYSTLLYLDLPLAVAMAVAAFEIERLASATRLGKLPGGAGWYALLLLGLLKETALVFLLVAFLFCAAGAVRSPRRWLRLGYALFAPLALFTLAAGVQRDVGYSFRAANLATLSNYRILGGALWDQYGLLLALAAAGLILLAIEKRFLLIAFCLATLAAYTAFYLGDGAVMLDHGVWRPKYLGHARFMLACLPALAVFGVHALRALPRALAWAAAAIALAGNLFVYPVSTVAAPAAHWGDYVFDTSDHFYPYNIVFERCRAEFPRARRVIVVGPDFYYPYLFYQRKWGWPASIDAITLPPRYSAEAYRRSLVLAMRERPELIWVHVMHHLPLAAYRVLPPGYVPAGDYQSRFERIFVFRRAGVLPESSAKP
ncbi:MAG TPA: hypothetical protein VEU62_07790 [Bryobacterales bacterium]|nr:hypothetical protein [Bryobacterales bacterium]